MTVGASLTTGGVVAAPEWRALGTRVGVAVCGDADLDAAVAAVRAELEAVEEACSRFREDSELSRLNRARGREVVVSPLLAEALAVALRAAALTDGAVDPTVGAALAETGYDVDFDRVPREGPAVHLRVRPVPGWRTVRLDPETRRVGLPPAVRLDLGATAKALAADRAAAAAVAATGGRGGVLVNCGGDVAVAGTAPPERWTVRVAESWADGAPSELVSVVAGGLATSGVGTRRWVRGGRVLHHIIDPGTGLPAPERWLAVTVAAATCVDANIASTAAIVKGTAAVEWLERWRLPSRLVTPDGEVLRVAGWPLDGAAREGAITAEAIR